MSIVYPHMFRTEHTESKTTSSAYGSFYTRQKLVKVKIPKELVPLLHFVDDANDEFVENLREFVAVENVAGIFEKRHDMTKMILLVVKWFKKLNIKFECFDIGWFEMSNACCKLPNVILGETISPNDSSKKVLLVYCHLDVPNPDIEKWKSNPFELTENNNALYGSGTSYGKGVLLCWLHTLYTYKKFKLELPVKIKFVVESMHEKKSVGLEKLLHSRKLTYFADIDYIVVNESCWLGTKMPCLTYGAVGMCRFEVLVEKFEDSNPREDINKIFSCISDPEGNILIPHFNDHVVQITPDEEKLYDIIHYDFDEIKPTLPPHQQNWDKLRLLMKFWRLPSIIVHDVEECQCPEKEKKVEAYKRKFTIKIVPLQLPAPVCEAVIKHVYKACEDMCCESKVHCEMVAGSRPWMEDFASDHYEAARRATIQIYKEDPNLIREDKEIPVILMLQRVLPDKNILLLPLASGDCNAGMPNENIRRKHFFEGTKLLITYLHQLAQIRK